MQMDIIHLLLFIDGYYLLILMNTHNNEVVSSFPPFSAAFLKEPSQSTQDWKDQLTFQTGIDSQFSRWWLGAAFPPEVADSIRVGAPAAPCPGLLGAGRGL